MEVLFPGVCGALRIAALCVCEGEHGQRAVRAAVTRLAAAECRGCIGVPPHQERVAGIGREARVFLMQEDDMPDYWVADALTDKGVVEVWVHESAGSERAVAFLRSAVDRF